MSLLSIAIMAASLATTPAPAPQEPGPGEAPGVPWVLIPGEGGAMIVQSDTHGRSTMLICKTGSRLIFVTHDLFTPLMSMMTLSAGDRSETYPLAPEGSGEREDEGERRFMIAQVPSGSPVLAAFRAGGRMVMAAGDERIPVITTSDTAMVVERFLASCG